MSCYLEILDVAKSYGRVKALDGVTLAVRGGEIYGLLGPNGAGKTTLLKVIVGLLKPDMGTARICGVDVTVDRESALKHVGYVPENPVTFENLTMREFFEFVASLKGIPKDVFEERVETYVSLFQLEESVRKRMGKLSRGTVQKALVVASLMAEPKVLVMDEPTSGMDPEAQHVFREVVKKFADKGAALIISSHQLHAIERFATRIGIINRGKLLAEGTLDEVRRLAEAGFNSTLEEVFLKLVKSH
ncbi:MAG: ABC transporter ATP-binding protein [Thermofilaceae archaeon]|nr:ABC transporter ATP-binding protein [Thermofilaceae archaeon]MCX8180999.1 ABC transporter ATP-binding protein [Thermofilaceae archaeon]MDW8004104.1 ABC transporter ATP-binding protein [Thermofilaceae archaeon]